MPPARLFVATPEAERAFIEQRFAHFASLALRGFQRFGRGVLLITVAPPEAPGKSGTVEYVSDSSAGRVWPGGWPDAVTAAAVGEYDPATDFLALVLDYDARTCRLHRFEGETPLSEVGST